MIRFVISALFLFAVISASAWAAAKYDLLAGGYAALVIFCAAAFSALTVLLYRTKTVYMVTSRGVRFESGFPVKTNKREFSYRKIQGVDVSQSLVEKIVLRTGTVTISSAASDMNQDDIVFAGVSDPDRVARIIREGEDRQAISGRGSDPGFDPAVARYGAAAPADEHGRRPPSRPDGLPPR